MAMSRRDAWTERYGSVAPSAGSCGSNRQPSRRGVARAAAQATVVSQLEKKAYEPALERQRRYLREVDEVLIEDRNIPDVQVFDIHAVPKPRMSQRDKWEKRSVVARYRAYCDELRLRGVKLPYAYRVDFVLPMPASWPEWLKHEMNGKFHLHRPDTSNLLKAIEDALIPRDQKVHSIAATKRWGYEPKIIIGKVVMA